MLTCAQINTSKSKAKFLKRSRSNIVLLLSRSCFMTVWNYILKQSSLPVYFLRPQLEASSAGRHPHHSSAITLHSFISVVSVFIQFKDKNVVNEIIKEIKKFSSVLLSQL